MLRAAAFKNIGLGIALACVVAAHVQWYESQGADLTDDDLDAVIAAKAAIARSAAQ